MTKKECWLIDEPVHAIDISEKRVDETAKREHEEKNS